MNSGEQCVDVCGDSRGVFRVWGMINQTKKHYVVTERHTKLNVLLGVGLPVRRTGAVSKS